MKAPEKTKRQLLEEIRVLRSKNAKLERNSRKLSVQKDTTLKPQTDQTKENEGLHSIAWRRISEHEIRDKERNSFYETNKLLLIGVGLAASSWICESAIHAFIFHNGSFLDQILGTNSNELWMRLLVAFIIISFSVYAQIIVKKLNQTKVKLRQSYDELKESEHFLSHIFSSIQDGISVLDKDYNIINFNLTVEKWYRHALPVLGKKCYKAYHGRDKQCEVCPTRDTLKNGRSSQTIVPKQGPKGKTVGWLELYTFPVMDIETGQIKGIIEYARDVTERIWADESLKENERRFRATFEQAAMGIAHVAPDGRFIRVNQRFCDITGYTRQETLNRTFQDITHPDDLEADLEYVRQVLEDEISTYAMEKRYLRKDGSYIWINLTVSLLREDSGEPKFFISVIEDISVRKKAEEQIKKQNEFFNLTIESLKHPFCVIDANDYTIKMANSVVLPGPVSKGLTCYHLTHKRDKPCEGPEHLCPLKEIKKTKRPVVTEHKHYCENGNIRDVEIHAHPVLDQNGNLVQIIEYSLDITERRRVEEKLLANQSQLRSLASELSLAEERQRRHIAAELHDQIGQTLALSKINLQSLGQSAGLVDNSKFKEILKSIKDTIEQVQSLTFDLSSPTLYKFGLEKAIDELLHDYLKKKDVICTLNADKLLKPLEEDIMVLLFQSVRELLINIVKHAQAHKVAVIINRDGDNIRIIIQDDGIGFDTNLFKSIEQRKGGFGLFNIRERLNYINGSFVVESQPGQGSRITLIAPLRIKTDQIKGNF